MNRPTTQEVFREGQQAAYEGKEKKNPYIEYAKLGKFWKKGYEQFVPSQDQLFEFTEQFNYPKAKMSKPHILLKDGDVLRFCSLNAGQFVGYDGADQRQSAMVEDVAAIQYNDYITYHKWRMNTL